MINLTDDEYQTLALTVIREYKNFPYEITDDELKTKYAVPIKLIIENYKNSFAIDKSVVEEKQGERDVKYRESIVVMDDSIKAFLGYPYVAFR